MFNRKLNPIKERRPWSLLEKNPVSAELMHILYVNTFPWPTTLCFYGYQDGTRSKVTGNFLVNALHAFHRFIRRHQAKTRKTKYLNNIKKKEWHVLVRTWCSLPDERRRSGWNFRFFRLFSSIDAQSFLRYVPLLYFCMFLSFSN